MRFCKICCQQMCECVSKFHVNRMSNEWFMHAFFCTFQQTGLFREIGFVYILTTIHWSVFMFWIELAVIHYCTKLWHFLKVNCHFELSESNWQNSFFRIETIIRSIFSGENEDRTDCKFRSRKLEIVANRNFVSSMKYKIMPFKKRIYSIQLFAISSNWTGFYADFGFIFIIGFKIIAPLNSICRMILNCCDNFLLIPLCIRRFVKVKHNEISLASVALDIKLPVWLRRIPVWGRVGVEPNILYTWSLWYLWPCKRPLENEKK